MISIVLVTFLSCLSARDSGFELPIWVSSTCELLVLWRNLFTWLSWVWMELSGWLVRRQELPKSKDRLLFHRAHCWEFMGRSRGEWLHLFWLNFLIGGVWRGQSRSVWDSHLRRWVCFKVWGPSRRPLCYVGTIVLGWCIRGWTWCHVLQIVGDDCIWVDLFL